MVPMVPIMTSKPGGRVSWQVTGVLQDADANAHRIPVEVEKSPPEHGLYLHPELFGASEEQAIGIRVPLNATTADASKRVMTWRAEQKGRK
jgi:hypothetical protein